MGRSLLAGIGAITVLIVAACSPDEPRREPLAPTDPLLAPGGGGSQLCSGSLASDIVKQQKALFTTAQLADFFDPLLTAIKNECPTSPQSTALMTYIQKVVDFRLDDNGNISGQRARALVKLWLSVTTYATSAPPLDRPHTVLLSGTVTPGSPGVRSGGAAKLDPTANPPVLEMTTFDGQAGVRISSAQTPTGPHFFTFDGAGACPPTTLRAASEACYNIQIFPLVPDNTVTPPVPTWNPLITVGMCIRKGGPTGISHDDEGYTEVLPGSNTVTFPWTSSPTDCTRTHSLLDSWLGREAGPLGRALARAVDYLRPQTLYAVDAGETGEFSPFGGVLTVVFEDGFTANAIGSLANGTDPVVGDFPSSWDVMVQHPGFVNIQNGLGDLTGNVVVISQALGNCSQCPTMSLLGTRVNPSADDTIGTYDITWQSLQDKGSVKEAPFVVRSFSGAEIARLSYVSEMGASLLKYNGATVMFSNAPLTWTKDIHHDFKITVNLHTKDEQNMFTTSLAVRLNSQGLPCGGQPPSCDYQTLVSNVAFTTLGEKTVSTIGYFLTGIDAGVIAADNFLMQRKADPPQ